MRPFSHFHFACTGALAIEAAAKTAMIARGNKHVATFNGSFHGINGYGGMLASLRGPASQRLSNLPFGLLANTFDDENAYISHEKAFDCIDLHARRDGLSAILVEPIQCTAGDKVVSIEFLRGLRKICDDHGIPLIFDEIQTGFGGTGTMWYFEQLGFVPDIVVFGKKTQVSGIMVREPFAQIFKQPSRLEVTWDGDVLDMIRCRAILEAYEEHRILDNVRQRGEQLQDGLSDLNVRRVGLLMAIDFEDKATRDDFVKRMWEDEATIMIPTGERCVRLRPNLAITEQEVNEVARRVSRVTKMVAA
jgi:L-lysine 6-transaminase